MAEAAQSYALVTGASAGLGAEFARQLAASGQSLVLCARRLERLRELAQQLASEHGVDVQVIEADLSCSDGALQLWREIQRRQLSIDTLINNAGSAGGDLLRGDWAQHQAQLNLMTQSVAALCHLAVPAMVARGRGQVLNVASVAGRLAEVRESSYGPTKAYVIALSQGLSHEVQARGVQVMALCPGFVHTDFHQSEALKAMKHSTPKFLWYDAETVVTEALHALQSGKNVYLSGRLYRWLDPFLRVRWLQRLLMRGV